METVRVLALIVAAALAGCAESAPPMDGREAAIAASGSGDSAPEAGGVMTLANATVSDWWYAQSKVTGNGSMFSFGFWVPAKVAQEYAGPYTWWGMEFVPWTPQPDAIDTWAVDVNVIETGRPADLFAQRLATHQGQVEAMTTLAFSALHYPGNSQPSLVAPPSEGAWLAGTVMVSSTTTVDFGVGIRFLQGDYNSATVHDSIDELKEIAGPPVAAATGGSAQGFQHIYYARGSCPQGGIFACAEARSSHVEEHTTPDQIASGTGLHTLQLDIVVPAAGRNNQLDVSLVSYAQSTATLHGTFQGKVIDDEGQARLGSSWTRTYPGGVGPTTLQLAIDQVESAYRDGVYVEAWLMAVSPGTLWPSPPSPSPAAP